MISFDFISKAPFNSDEAATQEKLNVTNLNKVSPEAKDLVVQLLEKDPHKRLSDITRIKLHPFFQTDFNWSLVSCNQTKVKPWSPIFCSGFLDKLGEKVKNWKKRWGFFLIFFSFFWNF